MALTVSSISTDSNNDTRQVIGVTGTGQILFAGWVDRIHKDCLHSSVYSYLNIGTTSFSTVNGTGSYTLSPTNIRRIMGVFDTSTQRILFPIERATSPVSQVEKQESNAGQQGSAMQQFGTPNVVPLSLQGGQPAYFRHIGAQQLNLYPTPSQPRVMNVSFEKQVTTLVNPTDVLLLPDDARDMVVAGVDYLASMFLKRAEEAQIWAQVFTALKKGESLT